MLNSKEKQLCEIFLSHKETQTLQDGSDPFFLRHLSPIRTNLVEWLDYSPDEQILELGGSTGILTAHFCRRAKEVRSVVEVASEAYVNRLRNRDRRNLTLVAPKVQNPLNLSALPQPTLEDRLSAEDGFFDTVALVDPTPALAAYLSEVAPGFRELAGGFDGPGRDFGPGGTLSGGSVAGDLTASGSRRDYITLLLRFAKRMLAPGGRLIFAAKNRLGLEYFAGAVDPASPRLFDAVTGEASGEGPVALTKNAIERALTEAGFARRHFFYPTPDHVYPNQIFSEGYLPGVGDVRPTSAHYDRERYRFFDEKKAFDSICEDGLFETFANSYLVVARENGAPAMLYSKYNNTRREHFATRTSIYRGGSSTGGRAGANQAGAGHADASRSGSDHSGAGPDGSPVAAPFVTKSALYPVGQVHVEDFPKKADLVKGLYADVEAVEVSLREDGSASFPFLKGKTAAVDIEAALGSLPKAVQRLKNFLEATCRYREERIVDFEETVAFREVFGPLSYEGKAVKGANIDEIPDNFLLTPEGTKLIDYEWVFPFAVPIAYIRFRSVYYFFVKNQSIIQPASPAAGNPDSDGGEAWFLGLFGFEGEEVALWKRKEDRFQEYVHGPGRRSLYPSRYEKRVWDVNKFLNDVDDAAGEHDKLVADVLRHEDLLALRNYIPYFLEKKFGKKNPE